MTTEQIQEKVSALIGMSNPMLQKAYVPRGYTSETDLHMSLWEIALQLSILNSRKDPKDSADEPEERLPHAQLFAIYHLTKVWAEDKTGAVLSKVTLDKIRELVK